MIVEREEPKPEFMPIKITIQTEQEAVNMWHRLNVPIVYLERYMEDQQDTVLNLNIISMFEEFNKKFTLHKCED